MLVIGRNFIFSKVFKGILIVLGLKSFLWLMIVLGQSCTKKDDLLTEIQLSALEKYEKTLFSSREKIGLFYDSENFKYTGGKGAITDYDEKQAQETLMPLYFESINVLESFNLLEEYYLETKSIENPNIILAGFIIFASLRNESTYGVVNNFGYSQLLFNNVYGKERSPWVDCLLEASGIAGPGELLDKGINVYIKIYGVKGAAKILGKALGRTAGWVGVVLSLYDFLDCYNDHYVVPD